MSKELIHRQTIQHRDQICAWFSAQAQGLAYPIYSSYDIRDGGSKVANVDANIYPAGFNNICQTDRDNAGELAQKYLDDHYKKVKKLVLLTEEHTGNPYYWNNVASIRNILQEA